MVDPLVVPAQPDEGSFGPGSTLTRHAVEGVNEKDRFAGL